MNKKLKRIIALAFYSVFIVFFSSCGPSKSAYDKEYVKAWKALLKTEAWKNALGREDESYNLRLTASTNSQGILMSPVTNLSRESPVFIEKFNSLVFRAYFKIISEAENADKRLRENLVYWEKRQTLRDGFSKELKHKVSIAKKKYQAHTQMLEGLKLWNIFSADKSGDLDYFKAENENEIFIKFVGKENDDTMISFLVYKLADLYHFED